MKYRAIALPLLLSALLLTACEGSGNSSEVSAVTSETPSSSAVSDISAETAEVQDDHSEYDMYADFAKGTSEFFECSDGWSNGNMFNCTWRKRNVTFNDGKMQLIIDVDSAPVYAPYSGGEYRSKGFYGYGRYEVSMKAIKNDGVVSSFFTYTGPSDNNPWDEIDIEILGKDTTKVQFNYFTDGVGNHEYLYDLGFDAAEDFHTYAIEWHEDKIVWFVDGEEVYTAEENIPSTESKIMMNAWNGTGVDGWLNAFDDSSLPLTAEYQWVGFTAFDEG